MGNFKKECSLGFETEYQLERFRTWEPGLFDQDGKRYTGTSLSNNEAQEMLRLINQMEKEINLLRQKK